MRTISHNSISKALILAIMLISFVGQALAFISVPCGMSSKSNQSQINMVHSSMIHHEQMNHAEVNKKGTSNLHDCCGPECSCPVSACFTVAILPSNMGFIGITYLSENISTQIQNHPKTVYSSLFRPPIFA